MKMHQKNENVIYTCPNYGYIKLNKPGQELDCPACSNNPQGWEGVYKPKKEYAK